MKTRIFLFLLIANVGALCAQDDKYNKYIVEIGGGVSNMFAANPDATGKFSFKGGIYWTRPYPKSDGYRILDYEEAGLAYVKKGARLKGFLPHYSPVMRNVDVDIHYLEVPFMIGTRRILNESLSTVFKFGCYAALGLASSATAGFENGGVLFSEKISDAFSSHTFTRGGEACTFSAFNRWDFGAVFGCDIIYKRCALRVLLSRGTVKLHPDDKNINNSNVSIGFGYML